MKIKLEDIRLEVWAGIRLLNERYKGWRRKINLRKLNLASPTCCTLGEVYGEYGTGKRALNLDDSAAIRAGFLLQVDPNTLQQHGHAAAEAERTARYKRLTAEWRAAYRAGELLVQRGR